MESEMCMCSSHENENNLWASEILVKMINNKFKIRELPQKNAIARLYLPYKESHLENKTH